MPACELTQDQAIELLRTMLKIRRLDEWIVSVYATDVLETPVHLHIGQEAVPAGVCAHLTASDTIFFGHRTHGPALAKGMSIKKLVAELYGRTTGCSGGFGGSMHVVDPPNGMLGSSAIVGGCIALGVGSAMAAKLQNSDRIAVSYFGDAASNSGVFWESINFAALKDTPVLFVCENNNLSNTMPQSQHMFVELTNVAGQFMHTASADGTDVIDVCQIAGEAIRYVRRQRKPAFVECKTKRWMKHQGVAEDDLDINPIDRAADCPIARLQNWMFDHNIIAPDEVGRIESEIADEIEQAVAFSQAGEFPKEEELLQEV